jgi:arylsulfatase A-like enzyme
VTDLIAKEAVEWIAHRGDRPFFLYVALTAVHIPIKEPPGWKDRYADIREPDRREYAACVTHLDAAMGDVVAALDRAGKRDNTVIVFFSDNGGTQARNDAPAYPDDGYTPGHAHGSNLPLRGNKTELYDGGIRVPACINCPRRLSPRKFTRPVHAVDWMPTLCQLAGLEEQPDQQQDGTNIWPWLTGEESPAPRPLYWAGVNFETAAVREGDWKLIVHRDLGRAELFNLARDPSETNDMAIAQPGRVAQLQDLLNRMAAGDARLSRSGQR